MREITSHIVEGDDKPQLLIEAGDDIGAGGAPMSYSIYRRDGTGAKELLLRMQFQSGDPRNGWNGIADQALLAIVADRWTAFQNGPFPAQETATALSNVNNALRAVAQRTMKRLAQGIEGKHIA